MEQLILEQLIQGGAGGTGASVQSGNGGAGGSGIVIIRYKFQ